MRIYIESTMPSYIVSRPSRDRLRAAHQRLTRDSWERRRASHDLFASQVVLDEIADGEPQMARKRLALMAGIPILDLNSEAIKLANRILAAGILPPKGFADATHIALATVYELDLLLSWNCRHIANPAILLRVRKLATAPGGHFR